MNKRKLYFLDLFAGAGGLSEGFVQAGFVPVAHVEMDSNACETLKTRECSHWLYRKGQENTYRRYLRGEIDRKQLHESVPKGIMQRVICETMSRDGMPGLFARIDRLMNVRKITHVDLMLGGPPCQAYSVAGRARKDMSEDPRNHLYKLYLMAVEKYQPDALVFENVPGILSAGGRAYLNDLEKSLEDLGYKVDYKMCNASDYGVLQNRKRIILVAWKKETGFSFPEMDLVDTHDNTVADLLNDLPSIQPGEEKKQYCSDIISAYLKKTELRIPGDVLTQHRARTNREQDRKIYRLVIKAWNDGRGIRLNYSELPEKLKTHKNTKDFQDRFKVVAADEHVSQTMVAHICKDGHYYIHPDIEQARSLSVREAARIQSFPDNFYFEGGQTAAFRQIGNAVPPLLAKAIAKAIKKQFKERESVG